MPVNNGFDPATHFGKQVRKARKAKGWSIHVLAAHTGLTAGHWSRVENGTRGPTEKTALALDRVFPERQGWFTEYHRDSVGWTKPGYRSWVEHERGAKRICAWVPGVIHGLVQTEAYARTMQSVAPRVTPEMVAARTAAHMERQAAVLRRDSPPSIHVVVDELSLYRRVGPPADMAAQMEYLIEVEKLPHVMIQVLPAEAQPGLSSELIVADEAAYSEHQAGGVMHTDAETVTELGQMFTSIQAECLRASESIDLFWRMRKAWTSGGRVLTPPVEGGAA